MKSRLLILSIILRATAGAACGQRAKSGADRSTALDSAYKAGILSKEEYEAKKRELAAAPPAPLPPPAAVRTG
ncbi:MAG: SHOCT domain-containing protein, partial [Acidobacteria bacterium]|nr:SHOCT domain-containing protein [Acidobacteriota bacterium]